MVIQRIASTLLGRDGEAKSVASPGKVSLHPDAFADEQLDLSTLPLEEVVERYKTIERKRTLRTEPDNEAEVLWRIRSAPCELLSSLDVLTGHLGVSRSVLTKCMSRQISCWFSGDSGLADLTKAYNDIYKEIKLRVYSTLRVQAETPASFRFVRPPEPASTSLSTIAWLVGELGDIKKVLGISVHDLFMVGLMWSISTLEHRDWDKEAVDKFFAPEVYNFETLVVDRRADVDALCAKYKYREATGYNNRIYASEPGIDYKISELSH